MEPNHPVEEVSQTNRLDDELVAQLIETHWDTYDATQCGVLDKIETLNLLNEILSEVGLSTPNLVKFNITWEKFDNIEIGVLQKQEFKTFINKILQ